jgi:hypothetical protein
MEKPNFLNWRMLANVFLISSLVLLAWTILRPIVNRPPPDSTRKTHQLRSTPLAVADKDGLREGCRVFGLDTNGRPLTYLRHSYENLGDVITDTITGLMWQRSGSAIPMAHKDMKWEESQTVPPPMPYRDMHTYIQELNRQGFAGYTDWRLPTIPELMSLLEPEKQANGLYINPMFDVTQLRCWSADPVPAFDGAWIVSFKEGAVFYSFSGNYYVRAVRTWKAADL